MSSIPGQHPGTVEHPGTGIVFGRIDETHVQHLEGPASPGQALHKIATTKLAIIGANTGTEYWGTEYWDRMQGQALHRPECRDRHCIHPDRQPKLAFMGAVLIGYACIRHSRTDRIQGQHCIERGIHNQVECSRREVSGGQERIQGENTGTGIASGGMSGLSIRKASIALDKVCSFWSVDAGSVGAGKAFS